MVADGSSGDFTTAELPCRWDELTRFRSIDVVDDVPLEMPPGGGVGWPQLWEERLAGCGHGMPMPLQGVRGHITDVTGQPASGLPPAAAMAGVVQPRGHEGVELRCLVCGQLFVAKRRNRRTCSPACARRDGPPGA
jgi:hypothetical protein